MTKAAWILFYCAGQPAPGVADCKIHATEMYDQNPAYFLAQPDPYPTVTIMRGSDQETLTITPKK